MYIQLTTRCNMTCAHCCFSCSSSGTNMTKSTFSKVLSLCDSDFITLGGGEPTLHPHFKSFLLDSLSSCEGVSIITNGSIESTSLLLAKLTKAEVLHASLSIDPFHNSSLVSTKVLKAFKDINSIRSTNSHLIPSGRAKSLPLESPLYSFSSSSRSLCPCDDLFCTPSGIIYSCGCKLYKIGSVHSPDIEEKLSSYNSLSEYSYPCAKDFLEDCRLSEEPTTLPPLPTLSPQPSPLTTRLPIVKHS